ncbi:DUF222 domain-containing protein, partial [Planotetraspora kaengkrachanensis]|uniref:DUF222 domain-containing protein n=1 Tax=Planotetraspora kaengkrachanensis TaxID=575193 RepID=UPI001EF26BEB
MSGNLLRISLDRRGDATTECDIIQTGFRIWGCVVAGSRVRRSSSGAGGLPCGPQWWAEVTARAGVWSSDGSSALKPPPCGEGDFAGDAGDADGPVGAGSGGVGPEDSPSAAGASAESSAEPGFGDGAGVSSWGLVVAVEAAVSGLVGGGVPGSAADCAAEVEVLVGARDRLVAAIAARVGVVHRGGEAKARGHGSTRSWLRGGCGLDGGSAGRVLGLAVELARLPVVAARFAAGELSEGVVAAICVAVSGLSDAQVRVAEPILVELAERAGPAEVARAGRYLREILDPGVSDRESEADQGRRFLRVRPMGSGGVEGEFRLPREAGARLRAWLDAYARPGVVGDDRPLRVRNADALIALLGSKVTTELLVLVPAESLPDDHPANPANAANSG